MKVNPIFARTLSAFTAVLLFCIASQSHAQSSDNCDYSSADLQNGWGWDPVNAQSCPPRVADSDQNACIDSDGDGWGWNGTSSCQINTVAQSVLQCSSYNTIELTSGAQYALVNERESPENLAVANLQTSAIQPLVALPTAPPAEINTTNYTAPVNPLVSDNGQRVLFLSNEERTVPARSGSEIVVTRLLFVADVNAGTVKAASVDERGMNVVATTNSHEISADAKTAVFESTGSNQQGIYVRHLDTEQTIRITETIDADYNDAVYQLVDMSSNGDYVLFYADLRELGDIRDNKYFMYDVSADTVTEVTALTHRFYNDAVVANDGTTITYAWQAGVFLVNVIDGSETEIFDQFGLFASMSPNGRYISNISSIDNTTNNQTLSIFDRQTGNVRELTITRSNYRFTDDSNGLIFTRDNISSVTDNESLICGRTYLPLNE